MAVQDQAVVIWAGTKGHLDDVPVEDVRRFETELVEYMRTRHGALLQEIVSTGAISDEDAFGSAIAAFAEDFHPSVVAADEPDVVDPGAAETRIVDADTTLPEEDITREDD